MKIIIIGDGKLGYSLADSLSKENNDVTIIDKDPQALRKAADYLDVMCIKGNGLSTSTLLEAGIRRPTFLSPPQQATKSIWYAALQPKSWEQPYHSKNQGSEYANELTQLKADLDLDMIINPNTRSRAKSQGLLSFPAANVRYLKGQSSAFGNATYGEHVHC